MGPSRPREPGYPSDRGRGHRRDPRRCSRPFAVQCVQEFEGPSCAPKRNQRQHVNEACGWQHW